MGTLKATDADKGTVTIVVLGEDRVFRVTRDTRVVGADGRRVGKPFDGQMLAAGTAVAFKAGGGDPPHPRRPEGARWRRADGPGRRDPPRRRSRSSTRRRRRSPSPPAGRMKTTC